MTVSLPQLVHAPVIAPSVHLASQLRGVFGESAVWSPTEQGVWWVDMHGHALVLSRPDGSARYWKTPGPHLPWARAVVLREGGGLIVALSNILAAFDIDSGMFSPLPIALKLPEGHLFNDATVDAAGRLIIGTMLPGRGNDGKAQVYAIDPDRSVRLLIDGFNTTNGLAFSPDGQTLYVSDSHVDVRQIWQTDYDLGSGTIGPLRPYVDFTGLPGKPDGAAIDADGYYWIAGMASPYLHRFDPAGQLQLSIRLPINTPTRPAFGGPRFRHLFITSGGLKDGESDDGLKGGLLACEVPFAGLPANLARL